MRNHRPFPIGKIYFMSHLLAAQFFEQNSSLFPALASMSFSREGRGGEYIMSPWSEMISQTVNQCREVPRANKISVVARKASKR